MLNLIEGGFFSECHGYIKKQIRERTLANKRTYLIVPEQQTVAAEGEMAELLSDSVPLTFEVTNFTRFADTVFRALGGLCGEWADNAKRAVIMWQTMSELLPTLSSGYKEITAGNVQKTLSAVQQMQSLSLTPEELSEAYDKLCEGDGRHNLRLRSKLSDLSLITSLYKKKLQEKFSDSDDAPKLAAKKLATGGAAFSDAEFFIEGFTSFTEPQMQIIRELIKISSVTVHLTLPKELPDAFEYTEIKQTHRKLVELGATAGCEVSLKKFANYSYGTNPLIKEICDNIWRANPTIDNDCLQNSRSVKLFEAQTTYDECDFVASDIKRRIMTGSSLSDFAVIARDIDEYAGLLSDAFEKAELPLFISKRKDIGAFEIVKLIYSAYSAINGGFKREDVISYSKCHLCGISREDADEFELYVDRWQIDKERFIDGIFWNMNPDGYTNRRRDDIGEQLTRINETKEALILPLIAFREDTEAAKCVKEYATALITFLGALGAEEGLEKRAAELYLDGRVEDAKDCEEIWQVICGALDTLCDTIPNVKLSADAFVNVLKIVFSSVNFGRIPSYTEQVISGSANTARISNRRHVYIIGLRRGVFPKTVSDDSYFSDREKLALEAVGLPIHPELDQKSAMELYYFTRALASATEDVTLIYSTHDSSLKPASPSDAVLRISAFAKVLCPVKLYEVKTSEKAYTKNYAIEHLSPDDEEYETIKKSLVLAGCKDAVDLSLKSAKNDNLMLGSDALKLIYQNSIALTQSRIEKYNDCPFGYFCQYNLKLDDGQEARWSAADTGSFVHSIVENFFRELKESNKSAEDISDSEKDAMILRIAKNYTESFFEGGAEKSARIEATIKKLCRAAKPVVDSLCEEFSNSKYKPVFFELEIKRGVDGAPSPAVFNTSDGREVYIFGTIDRVDAYKSDEDVYVRVIDYKTGKKDFSPDDLAEGKNLQMFLYLKSIVDTDKADFKRELGAGDGGRLIPGGVIYVKADVSDGKLQSGSADAEAEFKKQQKRVGMILDDEENIGAMNPDFLPIKLKASDGRPDARSANRLYNEEGWRKIEDTIKTVMTNISDKMTSGDIKALRVKHEDACKYCEFKSICRNRAK